MLGLAIIIGITTQKIEYSRFNLFSVVVVVNVRNEGKEKQLGKLRESLVAACESCGYLAKNERKLEKHTARCKPVKIKNS